MTLHVPTGWTAATIAELGEINPKHPAETDRDQIISFVPMAGVSDTEGRIVEASERPLADVWSGYTHFAEGDVLFAKITPCMENGKSAVARNLRNSRGCGSTEFYVVRSNGAVLPEYLHPFLRQHSYRASARAAMTGAVGQLRVPKSFVENTSLPLPPLNEQRRIVAKIEALMVRSTRAREALDAIPALLDRYCQSVLAAAFRGDLTADWREQHPDVEPASELLMRIGIQRRERWQQAYPAKSRGRYKEPEATGSSGLQKLPHTWTWTTLGHLAWSVRDGPHYSPKYEKTGVPFITGGNVRPHGIDFEKVKYVSPDLHKELSKRCKPEVGDILYTKGGTTGIARVNTYNIDFNVWVHVAVLKCIELVQPFFIQHALNSPFCYEQAQKFTHGVGNQDLGLTRMVKITLPLSPVKEQAEIVRRIDDHFAVIGSIENNLSVLPQQFNQLNEAIFAKAFRGELVPQDPNDEPASALLARIKAARAANGSTPRGRRRKPASMPVS